MVALELAGVSKRYGSRTALSEVNLAVPGLPSACSVRTGPAKTTALRLLLGFTRPSGGGVLLHGHDPMDQPAREGWLSARATGPARAHERSRLPPAARFPRRPGRCGPRPGGRRGHGAHGHRRSRPRPALGPLEGAAAAGGVRPGLPRQAARDSCSWTEPTSGLDPIGVRDARDWISGARERGCTVPVSSHILSEVERTCDHVAVLHEGRVVASGPLDRVVRAEENLEDAFIRLVRG